MVMRGHNNVKTSQAILLVVVVFLVALLLQTQQVHADHCCCPGSLLVPAYLTCRAFGSVSTCCHYCLGSMTNQDGCPYPYVQPPGVSETNYDNKVVDYCKMGCMASVCNKITTSVASGTDGGKDVMESCNSACHDLCTKDNAKIAQVHGA